MWPDGAIGKVLAVAVFVVLLCMFSWGLYRKRR